MPGQERCPRSHWNTTKLLPRKQRLQKLCSLSPTEPALIRKSPHWSYAGSLKYSYASTIYSMSFQDFPYNAYSYNQEGASNLCWLVQMSHGLLGSKQCLHCVWADSMWRQLLFVAVAHQVSLGSVVMNASVLRLH